jgi:methyl-accepting chemotaxis protein
MHSKTINRQIITILALAGLLAALIVGWLNINNSKSSAIENVSAKANELVGRTAQMFMVSTIRFNEEFTSAQTIEEKNKIKADWQRTIMAVDKAVTHNFGNKQSRVRLFTDEDLLNVISQGKQDTFATGDFEVSSLANFNSGKRQPIIELTDDKYQLAVPLMSDMHPGCANCHSIDPADSVLLGGVAVTIPVTDVLDDAFSNGLISTLLFVLMLILSFTITFVFLGKKVTSPLNKLNLGTQDIVEGLSQSNADLSKKFDENQSGEISLLAQSFNKLIKILANIMGELSNSSIKLSSASERTATIAEQTRISTQQRLGNISAVVNSVSQLHHASQEVTQSAADTAEESKSMNQAALEGQSTVAETVAIITELEVNISQASNSITQLDERSDNIGNIVSTIDGIAEQTNLLALNAAIEAARAGEQGRGFAVVADEVRSLAQRTQDATREISQLVADLQKDSRDARGIMSNSTDKASDSVTSAEKTQALLKTVSDKITLISTMNLEIAHAANEQTTTLSNINGHMNSVEVDAKETLIGADEIVEESKHLTQLSEHLNTLINRSKG